MADSVGIYGDTGLLLNQSEQGQCQNDFLFLFFRSQVGTLRFFTALYRSNSGIFSLPHRKGTSCTIKAHKQKAALRPFGSHSTGKAHAEFQPRTR